MNCKYRAIFPFDTNTFNKMPKKKPPRSSKKTWLVDTGSAFEMIAAKHSTEYMKEYVTKCSDPVEVDIADVSIKADKENVL